MKAFPGAKARQFNHHTILLFENNTYDTAAIQFGISHLISNVKSTFKIRIGMIFISSIAYSSKVDPESV